MFQVTDTQFDPIRFDLGTLLVATAMCSVLFATMRCLGLPTAWIRDCLDTRRRRGGEAWVSAHQLAIGCACCRDFAMVDGESLLRWMQGLLLRFEPGLILLDTNSAKTAGPSAETERGEEWME